MTNQVIAQVYPREEATNRAVARPWIATGLALILTLFVVFVAWGSIAQIAGAVIAPGRIVVDSNPKEVQHQGGGIVREVLVRDGDLVKAGDLLIRLEDEVPRANVELIERQIYEYEARIARLEAELNGSEQITFPEHLKSGGHDVQQLLAGERGLFAAQRESMLGQKKQLEVKHRQQAVLVQRYEAQKKAAQDEMMLVEEQLRLQQGLRDKGLMELTRLTATKRTLAQLTGQVATAHAEIARAQEKMSETVVAIAQLDKQARLDALTELQSSKFKADELRHQLTTAADALDRVEIRAPRSGYIHDLSIHTKGAVIISGETLLTVVPVEDRLVVEARVDPVDVDRIFVGQETRIRFSGLDQRTTPEAAGKVDRIGADVTVDAHGQSYYVVRIGLDQPSEPDRHALKLVPGMPVEVFLSTGSRTAMSYFVRPLFDQLAHAFKE